MTMNNVTSIRPRQGIAIDLNELRILMHEFCNEQDGDLVNRNLLLRLTLSQFLRWLQTRQEYFKVIEGESE